MKIDKILWNHYTRSFVTQCENIVYSFIYSKFVNNFYSLKTETNVCACRTNTQHRLWSYELRTQLIILYPSLFFSLTSVKTTVQYCIQKFGKKQEFPCRKHVQLSISELLFWSYKHSYKGLISICEIFAESISKIL